MGAAVEVSPSPIQVGDQVFHAVVVEAEDNDHAIAILNALAHDDATDPEIVELAHRFLTWAHDFHIDQDKLAACLHDYVRSTVDFVTETGEAFRSAALTLKLGAGDCDDSTRCLCALAIACGIEARAVGVRDPDGEITHVAPQLKTRDGWTWAETTFEADFGEEPRSAAKRLGIVREDVT